MTGFDTTTYMLDLPKADAEHIDTALFLFREVASEVKFDPAAVDRERGVILGEERARDNFQFHQVVDMLGFQVPQTPYPNRLPIGVDAVLKTASADTIRNLYHRYYRPENATLVFVGDADPGRGRGQDQEELRRLAGRRAPQALRSRAARSTWRVPPRSTPSSIPPSRRRSITPIARPWKDPADTLADRQHKIVEAVATAMFNRRLQKLTNLPGSPLLGGGMETDEERDAGRMTTVTLVAKDGDWKDALTAAEQEIRRGRRARLHRGRAQDRDRRDDRRPPRRRRAGGYADEQVARRTPSSRVVGRDKFVTTPEVQVRRIRCDRQDAHPGGSQRRLPRAVDRQRAADPRQRQAGHPDRSSSPRPSTPAAPSPSRRPRTAPRRPSPTTASARPARSPADTRIADLGVRTVRFANNVRLNIKKTDFEAGKVRFLVRLGDGMLDLPKDQPGLAPMMTHDLGRWRPEEALARRSQGAARRQGRQRRHKRHRRCLRRDGAPRLRRISRCR